MSRRVVLVIGPGRSGTSSMAGALASAGFHSPDAMLGNEINPVGFFEPLWMVNLHRDALTEALVGNLDPDPKAYGEIARYRSDPAMQDKISKWLEEQLQESPQLVLKDPRTIWFSEMWVNAARKLDADPLVVMMLRHPSEVTASRATYFGTRDVSAVAGWINVSLLSQEITSTLPRQFVPYVGLLEDWREQFAKIGSSLDIQFDPRITDAQHPVDDHIDPSLRRMPSGWESVAVPRYLSNLADRVYDALIAESQGGVEEGTFESLRAEYDEMYQAAKAMTRSGEKRNRRTIRKKAKARGRAIERARIEKSVTPESDSRTLMSRVRGRLNM